MTNSSEPIIQAAIIHRILKKKDQKKVDATSPIIRSNLHINNEQTIKLIQFLDQELGKYGFAHSISSKFNESTTFSKIINDYLFNKNELLAEDDETETAIDSENEAQTRYRRITNKLTHALNYQIYEELKTTGDHLPIIFYQQGENNYVYMALLSLKPSITINEDTGEIIDTSMIDTQALKVAFKVKLDDMHLHSQSDDSYKPSNYISWVQKGNDDIPKYIQKYIPIKYSIDDKISTRKLMDTLEAYLAQSNFTNEISSTIHEEVLTLLKTKASQKKPINITEEIDPIIENKASIHGVDIISNNFKSYRESNGYSSNDLDASNIFSPAGTTLTSFEKFTLTVGAQKQIKISGRKADIAHTIVLCDQDESNPYVRVDIKASELSGARKILNNKKPYESNEIED
ncbi:nucleoid-associated protein [Acinetobacter sp. ANC 4945]|uniref:Nucleoid-associated protein n=1 Tax=Acinetobacter amyesii TaxID=2942470 RepID=A0A1T1GUI7_9GAMM|nr:nucleoid-associated protein [Acinetobacter amyesii]MCL6248081.1 nucleoid-associated protein [Acinetobacter amyesii]OOV81282.1 hypothetical protein B1202_12055 [Acinetobacter amyesii]